MFPKSLLTVQPDPFSGSSDPDPSHSNLTG